MNKNQCDVATEKYVAEARKVNLHRLHDQINLHNGFLSSKPNPSYQFMAVQYLMEKNHFTNISYLDTNVH